MTLEELRAKLLFNDTIDVWLALCEERGRRFDDVAAYQAFLGHLARNGVTIRELGVCAQERGKKALFVRKLAQLKGQPLRTQVIRLDERALGIVRQFESHPSLTTSRGQNTFNQQSASRSR